ncbi:hypothetical protein YPPY95_1490, partial [Yersinia pestis PY-95]
MSTTVAI